MKYCKFLLIVLIFSAAFVSCKKGCSNDVPLGLTGTWELRKAQGGMLPPVNHAPGNGNLLKFTNTGYEMYTGNQLVKSGSYTLVPDSTVEKEVCLDLNDAEYKNRIVYDDVHNSPKVFLQVSGNKLTFLSGCFALDGGSLKEYERK